MQHIKVELEALVIDDIAQSITKRVDEIKQTLLDVKAKNKVSLTTEVIDTTQGIDLLNVMMQMNPKLKEKILEIVGPK